MRGLQSTLFLWISNSVLTMSQQQNVCNDCWCVVPDGETSADTCPVYPTELVTLDSINGDWASTLKSFNLVGEPLKLVDATTGSSDCYPFRDSIGAFPTTAGNTSPSQYFESNFTQCSISPEMDTVNITEPVCVYEFVVDEAATDCLGRDYSLVTLDVADVDPLTMMVAHTGPCGVCSNAQDLGVRFATIGSFRSAVTTRATLYLTNFNVNTRFNTLVDSFADEPISLTPECARLWAHLGATNAQACSNVCVPPPGTNEILVVVPGTCDDSDCVVCNAQITEPFDILSGIANSGANAGFASSFPVKCNEYFVPDVRPCVGAVTQPPTAAPIQMETSDSSGLSHRMLLLWISTALVWGRF